MDLRSTANAVMRVTRRRGRGREVCLAAALALTCFASSGDAEDAKPKFDAKAIGDVLDRTPEPHPSKTTPPGDEYATPSRLASELRRQMLPCWKTTGQEAVTLRFKLSRKGALEGEPVVVLRDGRQPDGAALAAALSAVKKCEPFKLPEQDYALWQEVEWHFDPVQH